LLCNKPKKKFRPIRIKINRRGQNGDKITNHIAPISIDKIVVDEELAHLLRENFRFATRFRSQELDFVSKSK
jgi:hypothetical protein